MFEGEGGGGEAGGPAGEEAGLEEALHGGRVSGSPVRDLRGGAWPSSLELVVRDSKLEAMSKKLEGVVT